MANLQIFIPKRLDNGSIARNLSGMPEFIQGNKDSLRKSSYPAGLESTQTETLSPEELLSYGKKGQFGFDISNTLFLMAPKTNRIYTLLDVKVDVSRQNTIVKTPFSGRRGTVKEFICAEDYQVKISGSIFSSKQKAYPIEEVKQCIQLLEEEGQLLVSSHFLDTWGINKLVLLNYSIPQSSVQYANVQNFSMSFLSDSDISLEIEK